MSAAPAAHCWSRGRRPSSGRARDRPGLLAPVVAPLAGGLITTYASWHWMFLINVPLGVIAFFAAGRLVTDSPPAGGGPPAARPGRGADDLRRPWVG
jgi:MFS family permease